MAKRNRKLTTCQIEKRINEGRGKGRFENYLPWIRIQDIASKGLSTRIKGWKSNRIHQLLSKIELNYFYLLEWAKAVTDIREQFPLDLLETRAIAYELGIKHPTAPFTHNPMVMTTDFVITVEQNTESREIARTIKYTKDIDKRTLEKLEIERIYWRNRGISWAIVTEKDIDLVAVENIKWLHACRNRESLTSEITDQHLQACFFLMSQSFAKESPFLYQIASFCDSVLGLSKGQGIKIFRNLAANQMFNIDITQPLNPRKRLYLLPQNSRGES